MKVSRRQMMGLSVGAALALPQTAIAEEPSIGSKSRANRIGVSTYSFWHFRGEPTPIESCLEQAADMGFDGVEILHVHMEEAAKAAGVSVDNALLGRIKRRAFSLGLDLMGFSTHQGFVTPDDEKRQKNIEHTARCLELAHELGIATIRVNTGRWGTSKDFDELMANKGIEPRLPGYSDEQGFEWVIRSFEALLPKAEKLGVVMGLENHWGLGRYQVALAASDTRHRKFPGEHVRANGRPGTEGDSRPGEDLLWRRRVVFARHRLCESRSDPAQAQLPRLHLVGDGRQRSPCHRSPEESGDAEEGFRVGYSQASIASCSSSLDPDQPVRRSLTADKASDWPSAAEERVGSGAVITLAMMVSMEVSFRICRVSRSSFTRNSSRENAVLIV
jgi:hypothetical protein